jgi:HEAT repeat protein
MSKMSCRGVWLFIVLVPCILPTSAPAYIDVSPTLGRLVNDSASIVLLEVEKASPEKRIIIYRKVADLKGSYPQQQVKHLLSSGLHPREPASILDWAEPGRRAVMFHTGTVAQTCTGKDWYECVAGIPPWWTMTCGQAQLSFAYRGSPDRLAQHVKTLLAGKEVLITAVKYGADDAYWEACKKAVGSRSWLGGKPYPLCRFKASLQMPNSIYAMARDARVVVLPGAGGPEDVPALLASLDHPDWRVRADAAAELGLLGDTAIGAVPALNAALADPEKQVNIAVAAALVQLDPRHQAAVTILTAHLKDKVAAIRRRAAEALGDAASEARDVVPGLCAALADEEPRVRWAAAEALGRTGTQAEAAIAALTAALKEPEATTRSAAIDALGQMGPRARAASPALLRALRDPERTVGWAAASALIRIDRRKARAAVPLLAEALASTDSRTRWQALANLERMDRAAKQAVPTALLRDALKDRDIGVRGRAARILGDLGPRGEDATPALTAALDDADDWVRCAAAASLVKVLGRRGTVALPALFDGLQDEDADIRADCLAALKVLGPAGREAIPEILHLLHDRDAEVRLQAAEALWCINHDAASALPVILAALKDRAKEVRLDAVALLDRLGPEVRSAAPWLLALANDEAAEVRRAAAEALRHIDPAQVVRSVPENQRGWVWPLTKCTFLIVLVGISSLILARAVRKWGDRFASSGPAS